MTDRFVVISVLHLFLIPFRKVSSFQAASILYLESTMWYILLRRPFPCKWQPPLWKFRGGWILDWASLVTSPYFSLAAQIGAVWILDLGFRLNDLGFVWICDFANFAQVWLLHKIFIRRPRRLGSADFFQK